MQRIPIEFRYTRISVFVRRTPRNGYKWMLLDYFGAVMDYGYETHKSKAKEAATKAKKALTQ